MGFSGCRASGFEFLFTGTATGKKRRHYRRALFRQHATFCDGDVIQERLAEKRFGTLDNTPMITVTEAQAVAGMGITGDRRMKGSAGSARQITLIAAEHLDVVAQLLQLDTVDPARVRRNLVVSGVNLNALRYQQFRIGEVILQATALCHPCSRMDEEFGPGGQAALLGHGGLCAKILQGGILRVGDELSPLAPAERLPI